MIVDAHALYFRVLLALIVSESALKYQNGYGCKRRIEIQCATLIRPQRDFTFWLDYLFYHTMSSIGRTAATSFSVASRYGRRAPLHRAEYAAAICGMHTTAAVRQEPKLKENEPWAMPSPEAGPSRPATNATLRSVLSDTPTQKSSDASDPISSQTQPSAQSSSSSSPKPSLPKSRTRLPEWIPPHWQTHLQPDAQWRKDMLTRRKRLAQQAGQQLTVLGMKLNEVTGYKEVERLKELVGEKGKSCITSLIDMLT
jgi:hypothetical protein